MASYTPDQIDALIKQSADQHGLDPNLFRRQLQTESGLNQGIVNHRSGAAGIAQFMPGTAKMFGIDPMDAGQAVPAAALYMRTLLNKFGGDYHAALAGYNWGPGNVAKHGLAAMPPETQAYLAKVTGSAPLGSSYGGGGGGGGQMVPNQIASLPTDNTPSIRMFGNDAAPPPDQQEDPNAPSLADIFIRKGTSTG